jgi:hypothetical protein
MFGLMVCDGMEWYGMEWYCFPLLPLQFGGYGMEWFIVSI